MDTGRLAQDFDERGYCVAEALLSPAEVAALSDLTDRVVESARGVEAENDVFDLEDSHTPDDPRVRRIKKPHNVDPLYMETARHPAMLAIVNRLLGPAVRLHHSKVNMKAPRYGAPLEWHQDWAFIPHSRMALAIAAVMLDDVGMDNGPMLVLPGTHKEGLKDHHDGGYFVGAIDPATLDLNAAVPLTGPAGTVSFHHPLTIHGSALNESARKRRILFFEYAAADAWPLFYGVEYDEYNRRLVSGEPTNVVGFDGSFVRLPYPTEHKGSIYNNQKAFAKRHFKHFGEEAAT